MTDNNNKTTLKEAFDAELMKRLEENPPEIPTYEEFSAMVDKSLAERCRRRKRIAGIAAGFVVVLLAGILACTNLTTDVDADKNPKEEIITEDGVIIEDGGWGSSDGEDNVWFTTDWKYVKDATESIYGLMVPKYIPNGYKFNSLRIENYDTGTFVSEYQFVTEEDMSLEIEQFYTLGGESSISIEKEAKRLPCSKGDVFIQSIDNDTKKLATIQIDDGITVHIIGCVKDDEIINIIEGLSN